MSGNKITSDDLAKAAAALSMLGYGVALLALEKADQEKIDKKSMTKALNRLIKNRAIPAEYRQTNG